jgi:hypothetical protein
MMNLAQIVCSMERAGCTAQHIASVAADHERARIERRLYRAVKRALETDEPSPVLVRRESPVLAAVKPDSVPPPAPPPIFTTSPLKSAAWAGLLACSFVSDGAGGLVRLRPSAQRVGARLIEHHNVKTGRCDPSIGSGKPGDRGMATALGLDPRSVRRAIEQLIAAGFVAKDLHRGRGHTNGYVINFDAMAEIAAMSAPGAKPDSGENRTLLSVKPDGRVRQNRRRKQDLQVPRARGAPSYALAQANRPDPSQPQLYLPIVNSRPVLDKGDTAFGHAASRLWRDLRAQLKGEALIQATVRMGELGLEDRAVHAEMRQPGSGVFVVLTALHQDAHGPRAANGDG